MPKDKLALHKEWRESLVGTINDIAAIRRRLGQLECSLIHSIDEYHTSRATFVREELTLRGTLREPLTEEIIEQIAKECGLPEFIHLRWNPGQPMNVADQDPK